jgi:hypothetical protein
VTLTSKTALSKAPRRSAFASSHRDLSAGSLPIEHYRFADLLWNGFNKRLVHKNDRLGGEPSHESAMSLLDIVLLPLELLKTIETFLLGLDGFRGWRQAASDTRIRKALAKRSVTK